ncbi:MAG: ribonuclease HII [Candidatus Cloacimonetes bacterium]|nr:ribonuclease HII [Candidatus Cloacimonadota bacterium]
MMNQLYLHDLPLLRNHKYLIGVDEAGRGALAGPVVCAAVVLDYRQVIDGLNDSKQLSPARREALFEEITQTAFTYKVVSIPPSYIDAFNILEATLEGMKRAILATWKPNSLCLVDGPHLPPFPTTNVIDMRAVIDGDALHACIAAASILAKVSRDRMMVEYGRLFPEYGFERHKGYGTPQHRQAIAQLGPCSIHRYSFAPIKGRG